MGRKRRSVEERLAELKAKEAQLEAQKVLKDAESNPALGPLAVSLKGIEDEIILHSKGFQNGPQSFDLRRRSHELWLAEIDAAEAYATAALESLKARKEAYRDAIREAALMLTDGHEGAVEEFVSNFLANAEVADDGLNVLHNVWQDAIYYRKQFSESKKAPKRTTEKAKEAE